jgi:hypothetical protein
MSLKEIHDQALSNKISCYHEFLSRYSRTKKIVYGFVEGKEDPSFYRGFIESLIPDDWDLELWSAGSKERVYQVHKNIDWRRFSKKRVCFFVDRDLSDIIPEKLEKDTNIYVTNGYSIENDVVNRRCCKRVLTEVCGFSKFSHGEVDQICDLFENELEKFYLAMIPIMAWILYWRRKKIKAYLNSIEMKDLFSFVDGQLHSKPSPKRKAGVEEYIHSQCNIAIEKQIDISLYEAEFRNKKIYRKLTRGKYAFWFLIQFCLSARQSAKILIKSCQTIPSMNVSLSLTNGMTVIGNRARLPHSLRRFLNETFIQYIAEKAV